MFDKDWGCVLRSEPQTLRQNKEREIRIYIQHRYIVVVTLKSRVYMKTYLKVHFTFDST